VTADRALKRAIRERSARTGEKYTEARRSIVDGAPEETAASTELGRQLDRLVERGYPSLAGFSEGEFRSLAEPLVPAAEAIGWEEPDAELGPISFVLVPGRELVDSHASVRVLERRGRGPAWMIEADELARFVPIDAVRVPDAAMYLITAAEVGADLKNVTPNDALASIDARGRSPLTVEEGVALATQFPETVQQNGGWSLAGSRAGDKRVTALWISKGAPKFGWCWAGNPHTWLGTASCAARSA